MIKALCASAFVINPETKKILLIEHGGFNQWVQPGGHIEENETPEDAAVREVYEETGIKIKLIGERFPRENDFIRPLGIQNNRSDDIIQIDIIYCAVPIGSIEPVIEDEEAKDARWFSREELESLNVFEDIKITMDYILSHYIK